MNHPIPTSPTIKMINLPFICLHLSKHYDVYYHSVITESIHYSVSNLTWKKVEWADKNIMTFEYLEY